jgi:phospholipid/cholesterol/gamma-HCH transport system substrate-binding protein
MRLFSTEAKVGVVVLSALAALAWLTFQIGEFRFREKGYVIEAVFTTVSGLEEKAKVRLAGVLVGTVDRIYLREGLAHAILRLDDGVIVHEDSVVAVASIGILSERYVEITAGSRNARVLAPGAVVSGVPLVDLDQLIARLSESSETIRDLAMSIKQTFGGNESTVARLMENTNGLVDRVNALLDDNRRQVSDLLAQSTGLARDTRALLADNREELRATIANLREFSATLNRRAEEIADEVKKSGDVVRDEGRKTAEELRGEVRKTAEELRTAVRGGREDLQDVLSSLRSAAGKAEQAADSLTSILRKVDSGTGTLGRLVNDDKTLTNVDQTVKQLGDIAQKINSGQGSLGRLVTNDELVGKIETAVDSANRYLTASERLKLFLGYRGEYLAEPGDLKSYVTMKFQPRPDKSYILEFVDDPAGKSTVTHTQTTIERPEGGYTLSENTVVNNESEFKVSILFAKDFGQLTLRGGMMESQGGAGFEYRLLGDRLRLGFDGWDFGREGGPHLKLTGNVKLYKDVFLSAGVDDFYDESRRSAFIGGGILFSDEDLKTLLSITRWQ